ncbi:MGMT family protein [Natronomonas sp. EA1]|uniref:MGMT family protein n=1 Tax=Natronomonas sp. EA1 TaxID=3421655 RepID=UPI003EB7AB94
MDDAGLYARFSPYLDSYVQFGIAGGKVLSVDFPADADPDADEEHPLLDRIGAYLEGADDDFGDVDVALSANLPTDQASVLEGVRKIPYGEQASCEQVARLAGGLDPEDADDLQTIRIALDANPCPLLVPDHRVRDGPSAAPPAVEQKLRSLEGL